MTFKLESEERRISYKNSWRHQRTASVKALGWKGDIPIGKTEKCIVAGQWELQREEPQLLLVKQEKKKTTQGLQSMVGKIMRGGGATKEQIPLMS